MTFEKFNTSLCVTESCINSAFTGPISYWTYILKCINFNLLSNWLTAISCSRCYHVFLADGDSFIKPAHYFGTDRLENIQPTCLLVENSIEYFRHPRRCYSPLADPLVYKMEVKKYRKATSRNTEHCSCCNHLCQRWYLQTHYSSV